jgi:hypothetical protein
MMDVVLNPTPHVIPLHLQCLTNEEKPPYEKRQAHEKKTTPRQIHGNLSFANVLIISS